LLHSSTVCALTGVETGFAQLAAVMLDAVAARRKTIISTDQRDEILSGFANLPPHPDVVPALKRLRAGGYRTVAFTNSSLQLVKSQLSSSGLARLFDDVVSVEHTGSFKPDTKVYRNAAECLQRPVGELRLVATHDWDTHGAMVAGLLGAYVDRTGAPYYPLYRRPDVFAPAMGDVVEQIIAEDAGTRRTR